MRNLDNQEIAGRLEDLNTRLVNLYDWVNTVLKMKIQEYDKENDLQNNRLNKLEYDKWTKD